jgi:F420-dependent oxidoreductase-like protein
MRFGVFVPQGWKMEFTGVGVQDQWETIVDVAHRAEDLGYDSLWVYDHFHTIPEPSQQSTFECWTALAGLAQATQTIRLGQMVTCNSYRHPSYLAKVASCLDVMSGGRLEFGIGAGWYEHEYLGYGYSFDPPSARIQMMDEGIQVIKAMWIEDEVRFEGNHYKLEGAINRPKPIQQPHPPIWIGGGGEQMTLRVVAREGDYSNFGDTLDEFRHKSAVLESHCESIGRDFAQIGRSASFEDTVLAGSDAEASRKFEKSLPSAWNGDEVRPWARIMSTERMVHELGAWREAGCSYVILFFVDIVEGDSLELFATDVMPHLAS